MPSQIASYPPSQPLSLALPKGRMQAGVFGIFNDAGMGVQASRRGYRPKVALEGIEAKVLKPQNIVEMIQLGRRDVGFAGADWVAELDAKVVELVDTGLDAVRVVAAAPNGLLVNGRLPRRKLVVASEYERLTRAWIKGRELQAVFVRSYGATEVFPPDDADCIVDNTATGATLADNDLVICDELMTSSTRLYANPQALEDPQKRSRIEQLVLLVRSVIEARARVMLEINVAADRLQDIVAALPCMKNPTVAPLVGEEAFAVKAAVPRAGLPDLIFRLKELGGSDIAVSKLAQIIV